MTNGLSVTGKPCSTYSETIAADERAYENTTWTKTKEELHRDISSVIETERQKERLRNQRRAEQNQLPNNDSTTTTTITVYDIPGEEVKGSAIIEQLEIKMGKDDLDIKQMKWNGSHLAYLIFNSSEGVEKVMEEFGEKSFDDFKIERWFPSSKRVSTPSSTRSTVAGTPQSDDSSSSTRRRPDIRAFTRLVTGTTNTNNYLLKKNKQGAEANRLRREAEAKAKEFPDSPPSLANDNSSSAT